MVKLFFPFPNPLTYFYLEQVAFAVGTFDYLEASSNGITYRIYTAPGKVIFHLPTYSFLLLFTFPIYSSLPLEHLH